MFAEQYRLHCQMLNKRRRRLRMSYAVLAKRSGVSMTTVVRTLSGRNAQVSMEAMAAMAHALGMSLILKAESPVQEILEAQAKEKAKRLIHMVQGTSGLEAQALDDEEEIAAMIRQTVHELLAGSGQRLWSEIK